MRAKPCLDAPDSLKVTVKSYVVLSSYPDAGMVVEISIEALKFPGVTSWQLYHVPKSPGDPDHPAGAPLDNDINIRDIAGITTSKTLKIIFFFMFIYFRKGLLYVKKPAIKYPSNT